MSKFYHDEEHGVAYKVDPVVTSFIPGQDNEGAIVVQTHVKVTNVKKEKIRRMLVEAYPAGKFDEASAREQFEKSTLKGFISGAFKIAENEYDMIKSRYEAI